MGKPYTATLKLKPETKKRLERRMKYGDTQDSAVNDLLDLVDQIEGKPKPEPEQKQ